MKVKKKRCRFCSRWYLPDARTCRHQIACHNPVCRKAQHAQANRSWQIRHPGYNRYRCAKVRAWARSYPNYWQHYRQRHPDYVRRDNRRRVLARKKRQLSAKQDVIRQISVEKLKDVREIRPPVSAKQTAISRRVDRIIDYLFWKELSAKQMPIASLTGSVP